MEFNELDECKRYSNDLDGCNIERLRPPGVGVEDVMGGRYWEGGRGGLCRVDGVGMNT